MKGLFGIALSLALTLVLGSMAGASETETLPASPHSPVSSVSAEELRGQIVARNHAVLSSQVGAVVKSIKVREGENFSAGETLLELDSRSFQALLAQSRAAERLAKAILENTQGLAKMESASMQEVDKAKSELDISIQAKVLSELDLERCTIKAPFSGAVLSLAVGKGEYVSTGKPLMEIVGLEELEVHVLIPSNMVTSVHPGQKLSMRVHETGALLPGKVRQLSPAADPLNRSIKVFCTLDATSSSVKPGMTGVVQLVP